MRCSSSRAATSPAPTTARKSLTIATNRGDQAAGRGAAVHLAVGGRIRAGADADRRRQRPSAAARPSRRRCATPRPRRASCAPSSTPRPTASSCSTATAHVQSGQPQRRGAVRLRRAANWPGCRSPACSRRKASAARSTARCDSPAGAAAARHGREVIGRGREGGLIPLFMTMGRLGDGGDKFCAVLRDITHWKKAEDELLTASARRKRRRRPNPISSPRSATRSARRSTPSSASPR